MGGVGRESEVTQALRDSAPSFSATRYLMVVAVTLILYDHLLTLCDEVEHIWAARKWLNKLIFLVNRYIVETTLAGMAYLMLEPRSELSDKISLMLVVSSAIICTTVSHVMITLRVDGLWDHNRTITYSMLGGFVVTYGAVAAFFTVTTVDLHKAIFFSPSVNSCLVSHSPRLANGIWIAMVSFDVLVLALVLINAVNRPHLGISRVMSNPKKGGIVFFAIILCTRIFNLIFSLKTGGSETFLVACFAWVIFAIAICRFILRIEKTNEEATRVTGVRVWRPSTQGFEMVKVANDRAVH